MSPKPSTPRAIKREEITKPALEEFRRRLAEAAPGIVNFSEGNHYGKKTNRLQLPKTFCAAFHGLSQEGRVTLGFDGQILLVPTEAWKDYLAETRVSFAKMGCEQFVEELVRNSEPVRIDAKGRITFSQRAVEKATFKNEVLLCPGRTIEFWNPMVHREYREQVILTVNTKAGFPTNPQQGPLQT